MGFFLRNFLAGTPVVMAVVGVVPVHVHLAVVPVDVRHAAIGVTRARNFARFHLYSPEIFFKISCVWPRSSGEFFYEAF